MARGSVPAATAAIAGDLDAQAASIYVVSIAAADGLVATTAIEWNHACETPAELYFVAQQRILAVGYRAATYMHGHRSVPGRELRLGQGLCRDWMMIGNPTRVHVTGGDCRIIMLA